MHRERQQKVPLEVVKQSPLSCSVCGQDLQLCMMLLSETMTDTLTDVLLPGDLVNTGFFSSYRGSKTSVFDMWMHLADWLFIFSFSPSGTGFRTVIALTTRQ